MHPNAAYALKTPKDEKKKTPAQAETNVDRV